MSLPSYQEATTRPDPWKLVAPMLPINLLGRLCLVSKHFYDIFAPLLWFRPTELLLRKTNPLDCYVKFAKSVGRVRQNVRGYVTILDFRPLRYLQFSGYHDNRSRPFHPQISGRVFSRWLQSLAVSFSCLKFIFADGLTESNLNAILSVEVESDFHFMGLSQKPDAPEQRDLQQNGGGIEESNRASDLLGMTAKEPKSSERSFQLVMLSLAGCTQFDTISLFDGNGRRNLLYLDISWTRVGASSLSQLANLPHLKILKLRGLRLKSQNLNSILEEMGTRPFSLDLRNNFLNDDLIQMLLTYSFLPNLNRLVNLHNGLSGPSHGTSIGSYLTGIEKYMEDAPVYRERADVTEEQEAVVTDGRVHMRPDSPDAALSHLLGDEQLRSIQSIHGLPLDGDSLLQHSGVTHLFLSDNQFSSDALRNLLEETNRLQVLDFGSVYQSRHILAGKNPNIRPKCQPDVVKLLELSHSQRLESLRVHHSVVTHTPTLNTVGEFHLSEYRRVQMSEEQYAVKEMALSPGYLLPDTNPRIKSLTLTGIPQKSSGLVIDRLLIFLHEASIQESLIAQAAPADSRRGAQMLTGLRSLRLEFEPVRISQTPSTPGPSVSGNADADIFMAESNKDFSFFDEGSGENEEEITEKDFSFFNNKDCNNRPLRAMRSPSISSPAGDIRGALGGLARLRDVKDEIVAYRVRTKAAFEAEKQKLGAGVAHVPLGAPHYHWTGQLELVS